VQQDEAQIEFAKTQLEYTKIRAPISGRVGIRQVDQGNILRAADGTTIVVLTQLKPISVVFTLSSAAAAQSGLTLGRVNIPVVALAADSATELDRGSINLVDNQVDPSTGTIKLKASFPNEQLRLWPGNFVKGKLVVTVHRQGLTVPVAAIRHGPRGDFVWVVQQDKTVQARDIDVTQTSGGRTLVTRGLRAGEQVVTEGNFLLDNGRLIEFEAPVTRPGPQAAGSTD
jgi:multidrug efflux system membrane fusion protein